MYLSETGSLRRTAAASLAADATAVTEATTTAAQIPAVPAAVTIIAAPLTMPRAFEKALLSVEQQGEAG
jgi:hypothetical protein